MICPGCGGALVVRAEGDGAYLHFRCRVGHGFGLGGLVELKEPRLEDALWTAVMAFEELAGLLSAALPASELAAALPVLARGAPFTPQESSRGRQATPA